MLERPVTSDSCAVGELTDNIGLMVGFFDGWEGNLARFTLGSDTRCRMHRNLQEPC